VDRAPDRVRLTRVVESTMIGRLDLLDERVHCLCEGM
jgi:hypothetical protein